MYWMFLFNKGKQIVLIQSYDLKPKYLYISKDIYSNKLWRQTLTRQVT